MRVVIQRVSRASVTIDNSLKSLDKFSTALVEAINTIHTAKEAADDISYFNFFSTSFR